MDNHTMSNTQLIHGDCLAEMEKLIAEGVKIDLTVTSPPYDNLRTYNNSLDWGEHIWKPVIEKLYNITADGGVVVWVVGDATINGSETGTSFKQALYFKEVGFNLHDTMIWNKRKFSAVGSLRVRYAPVFEYMFIFIKGKIKTFNPIKDRKNIRQNIINPTGNEHIRQKDGSFKKMTTLKKQPNEYGQRFNIWEICPKQYSEHPAPFPDKLAHDHIISWSNEQDIVFDPFMGSGTTGVACANLNRDFIGIEMDLDYFNIALERIKEEER